MWRTMVLAAIFYLAISFAAASLVQGDEGKWYKHKPADIDGNCIVDILDEQFIAHRWGSFFDDPLYDTKYDFEPFLIQGYYDWDIDVLDLQYVFGRDGFTCVMFWDLQTSMGIYSLRSDSESDCTIATSFNQNSSSNYVDPIGTVFFANAITVNLKTHAKHHGFPKLEHVGEQRFWEIGRCTFEDVDASFVLTNTCTLDPCEQWHFRSERGDQSPNQTQGNIHHVTWGAFQVATPHFDDDDNLCGHFVPQVFPYPEQLYAGFSGSGFEAGTYWTYLRFVPFGGHGFAGTEYWGNVTPIPQRCGDNQWPAGDGYVYHIEIY